MAHELEVFNDGTAAFFSARLDAWHRLAPPPRAAPPNHREGEEPR